MDKPGVGVASTRILADLEAKEKAAELSKPAVYVPTPLKVGIIGGVLWDDDISGQNETNEACPEENLT